MDPSPADPMERRKSEVARGRDNVINDYLIPQGLEFKLDGQREISDEYKLLLEWLLGAALTKAAKNTDSRVCTLLARLEWWRKYPTRKKPTGYDGPLLTLVGKFEQIGYPIYATGKSEPNYIKITIGIPQDISGRLILTDPGYAEMREELARQLALCFAHEGAHVWQLNKYDNDSHPWKRAVPEAPYTGDNDPGIEFEYWPGPVREAFNELAGGGVGAQAAGDKQLKRVTVALASNEYYRLAAWDRRGRELVSHLIELAYCWEFKRPFEEVLPKCHDLLDDVMKVFQPRPPGS